MASFGDHPNYLPVKQVLRANAQGVLACRALNLAAKVSDACDGATGRASDCVVLAKLVSAMVTAHLRLAAADCTRFWHDVTPQFVFSRATDKSVP
ncbi:MAG: hypothetical protein C4K47_08320 [Candidatus Thorarchaeota archaeon]|nr:MAG: hypothetical protein C4K47_08320 [Candidatus Thorarchaeota archaeon]